MKKNVILLFVSVLLMLSSCRSVRLVEVNPHDKISELLPALYVEADVYSFEEALYTTYDSPMLATPYEYDPYGIPYQPIRAKNVQNLITVYEQDVMTNVINPYGEKKGIIDCRITQSNIRGVFNGFSALSMVTLGIPNLFGMPLSAGKAELEVEVSVYDLEDKLIGRYLARGKGKEYVGLYFGYYPDDAKLEATNEAFIEAMHDIKSQISADADRLNKELN